MPVPAQRQVISSFLGLHEGMGVASIADVFSSGDSKNVWMDEFARVVKINGYAKQNTTAVTTDTGADATAVVGLYGYRKIDSGTTRVLVGIFDDATDEWEIKTSTDQGATWTHRADLGSGSDGSIPDFAQFLNDLFIAAGGTATPRVWNGTSVTTAGGTQSPTPSAAVGAAGNIAGSYEWKLVSIEADGTRHPGSAASSDLLLDDEKGSLSWTADADTDVVGYEVYRTTGTGKEFYFVGIVDGRTTVAFTDDLPDDELLGRRNLEEHGDAPPSCYLVEPHLQRMWFGRTNTNPRRAYYSDPGDPDSVWQDANYLDFDDDRSTGDFLTAMVGGYNGALVVFMERSIWTVTGTGELIQDGIPDWNISRSAASLGAASGAAVIRVPSGARYITSTGQFASIPNSYLAYFTPQGDIRLFDGISDTIISDPVKDTLSTLNYDERDKVFVLHDPARFHITWFFPSGSNTYCSEAVTWNYKYGVWYNSPTPATFRSGVTIETGSASSVSLLGEGQTATGGFVYELWSGNDFDGSAIEAIWFSKALTGMTGEDGQSLIWALKRYRWADLVIDSAGSETLTVAWFAGYEPNTSEADAAGSQAVTAFTSDTLVTADGDMIITADADDIAISGVTNNDRVYLLNTSGNWVENEALRLKVYDNSINPPWTMEALTIEYQVLPGDRTLRA